MPKAAATHTKQESAKFFRPRYFGKRRSNREDAEHALHGAAIVAKEDGEWTPELRKFIDAWLDFLSSLDDEATKEKFDEARKS